MALRYFIPDWDDRVDPDYNFLTDTHTPGRSPYRDDRYAHELFPTPPYDGILLSRAVIDQSESKRAAILEAGSVHRYLRLPADGAHLVLGDCGAFSYWQDENPPYKTSDVLAYYHDLGFDQGVSVDHLIFTDQEAERERRWNITVDNAADFLREHQRGGYSFTPFGVAQGWDPRSYQRAARALMQMGYGAIAIGGLVRSQARDIVQVLASVQEVLRPGTQVHLFGVTRPEYAATFARLGVTSFDSASWLRRAWMDGRCNYFLGTATFTAIRVPAAATVARKQELDVATVIAAEQAALAALRAFDRGAGSLEAARAAVFDYAALDTPLSKARRADYERTLVAQPWKQCDCTICRALGIEVIIFRGNNRNRRRGFHNTWQLYNRLQEVLSDEPAEPLATQLELLHEC